MKEETFDVVVIGGGGSGLAAASEAARHGAQVLLIEKNAQLGGSTAWSVGSVSATQTRHQKKAGIHNDCPDWHFEDLGKFAGPLEARDNLGLRRILVDESPAMFEWLMESGLVFLGPASEPPHRLPRMHNVVPGSKAYPYHLGRLCRGLGVGFRFSTRATSLRHANGRVQGVEAIDANGEHIFLRARKAVVLTSGDYSGGRELKSQLASSAAAACDAVNVTNTGDGHAMAMAIGAQVVNGDLVHGPIMRFIPPANPTWIAKLPPQTWLGHAAVWAMTYLPNFLVRPILMSFITTALGPDPGLFKAGGVLINRQGKRFVDEMNKPALALVEQDQGIGYIVLDGNMARRFTAWPHFVSTAPNVAHAYLPDYRRNRRDVYHQAQTIEDLALQLQMDPNILRQSLQENGQGAQALTQAPFVALGPVKSYMVLTDGGLQVSDRHEVIGNDGQPIAGLFAAGSVGQGGLLLYGHGHHLGWAFVSGRRAGRFAASHAAD